MMAAKTACGMEIMRMKALLYRYGSICEPDICDSLTRLGIEYDQITEEMTNKQLTPAQSIKITTAQLDRSGPYAFVFTINFFPWLANVCSIYHVIYISLIVDSPVMELYSNSIRLPYNRVFLFDQCLYDEFAGENKGNIFHIPLATNMVRNNKVISEASAARRSHFSSDISFIGSLYTEKCDYDDSRLSEYHKGLARGLMDAQLKVYGYNFIEECLTDEFVDAYLSSLDSHYEFPEDSRHAYKALVAQGHLSVKTASMERLQALTMLSSQFNVDIYTGSDTSMMPLIHNRGFAKSLTEMPLIFNNSKINLNITAKSIRSGLSLRIFDIMGCGGFLLTNYQAELPDLFEPGVDLETYSSMDELRDKCAYYLSHEDERRAIAAHGADKVARLHDYDTRLLQIFRLALHME